VYTEEKVAAKPAPAIKPKVQAVKVIKKPVSISE